jgi:DNA-binding transcriptional ArsR family regulator
MPVDADVSVVASLFAERARADMALALLGGEALTAGELARTAGLSPSAAGPHLARLVEGNALAVERQGRHRYYRLADSAVAEVLEAMLALAPTRPVSTLRDERRRSKLWAARTCYDHLAGALAVDLFDHLVDKGLLCADANTLVVPPAGTEFFADLGIEVAKLRRGRRPLARPCLDWTERRHHLAGALGAAVFELLVGNRSLERESATRAVHVTERGGTFLQEVFDVRPRPAHPITEQPARIGGASSRMQNASVGIHGTG